MEGKEKAKGEKGDNEKLNFIDFQIVLTLCANQALKMSRVEPNILVTGTPGVGKSRLAANLATRSLIFKLDMHH